MSDTIKDCTPTSPSITTLQNGFNESIFTKTLWSWILNIPFSFHNCVRVMLIGLFFFSVSLDAVLTLKTHTFLCISDSTTVATWQSKRPTAVSVDYPTIVIWHWIEQKFAWPRFRSVWKQFHFFLFCPFDYGNKLRCSHPTYACVDEINCFSHCLLSIFPHLTSSYTHKNLHNRRNKLHEVQPRCTVCFELFVLVKWGEQFIQRPGIKGWCDHEPKRIQIPEWGIDFFREISMWANHKPRIITGLRDLKFLMRSVAIKGL